MKIAEIHRELMLYLANDAYTPASVKYWVHEFKTGQILIRDKPRSRRRALNHIGAAILKRLLEAPFSWARKLNDDLGFPKVTVWEHMTKSLGL
jgi:hypothetical protein